MCHEISLISSFQLDKGTRKEGIDLSFTTA